MAKTTFRIEGLSQLQAKLRKLDDEVRKRAVLDAASAGAEPMVTAASRLCRRAPSPSRPGLGHIADNIVAENPRKTVKGSTLRLGPAAGYFWGLFLEFGTSKMRAYPFMRPAADAEKENTVREQKESLAESILREARGR